MKKFLKIIGIIIAVIILIIYLCFLFVLPNVIDLNQYKPMVQQIVKEQAHLDLDYGDLKIITTPLLGIGVKTDHLALKYEDGSDLITTDGIKARVALPSLLLMTVKVSCLDIENPKIDLAIENGENLKILQHVEKILLEQEKNIGTKEETPTEPSKFDVSKIRIKVPAVKFKNYTVLARDIKSKHNLKLSGEELLLGYFNGKTAKVKTNAILTSDDETKITANVDINTFIPEPSKLDEEDDKMQRAELPYANIVEIYRIYDLKTDLNTKLKIRQKDDTLKLWGYTNIDNFSMKFSNYTLPQSYLHTKFKGSKIFTDTNLSIAKDQNIKVLGEVKYDKKPKIDLNINTDKIYFKNVLEFTKAVMNTLHIKNDLASVSTDGFIEAQAYIKTNFKKLKSDGQIIIKNANFTNKNTGLNLKDGNAEFIFKDNTLDIKDTKILVDGVPFSAQGLINEKSVADIKIKTENMPLQGLFRTFAPQNLKNNYSLNSGTLSLDVNLAGELKKAVASLKASLNNFSFTDKAKSIIINNEKASADFKLAQEILEGSLLNKNLKITLSQTNSVIKNPDLKVKIDKQNIIVEPSKIFFNNKSEITCLALISDWQKSQKINSIIAGKLNSQDIKQLAGKEAAIFINAKGDLPLKLTYDGQGKRQNLFLQILADSNNYVTPINITSLSGKPSSLQAKIAFKGDRLKIKETGLFERNADNLKEILGLEGTITHLNSSPFINLFTVRIPKDLDISINGFKNAKFTFGGKVYVYGHADAPRLRGGFFVKDLKIADLLMTLNKVDLKLEGRTLEIIADKLNLNGSDIDIKTKMGLIQPAVFTIDELNIDSKNIDVDKAVKVAEAANKVIPSQPSNKASKPQEIPVKITNGKIKIDNLQTGNIKVKDILTDLSLIKSILYINNIKAKAFEGNLFGDVSMNLLSNLLHIEIKGSDINSEKALLDTANLKDTITGGLNFDTDLAMNAAAPDFNSQMKSIDGIINFDLKNGQLGPFGKLENMILAENIRESAFFQTALGGIISNLTTIDTTHFDNMTGHIIMKDAVVEIAPIYSNGSILNLYLIGDFDILKNTISMKVRAKLGSEISNMLGPIAAINPINLLKATPGMNIAMAKTFALFCEDLSAAEMAAIPAFPDKNAEAYATKFQIRLKGDVAKPLSLVKSFKWLVTTEQLKEAEEFVKSLPEPVVDEKGNLLQTEEEINAYNKRNKKITTKTKKAIKKFLTSFKKEKEKTEEN